VESKGGESKNALTAWTVRQEGHVGSRGTSSRSRSRTNRCPSVLDVARFESGELSELRNAVLQAHSSHCFRCGCSLAELQQARAEILGITPHARSLRSRRAAEEIQNLLRRRLH
jgi:hypothetical protein